MRKIWVIYQCYQNRQKNWGKSEVKKLIWSSTFNPSLIQHASLTIMKSRNWQRIFSPIFNLLLEHQDFVSDETFLLHFCHKHNTCDISSWRYFYFYTTICSKLFTISTFKTLCVLILICKQKHQQRYWRVNKNSQLARWELRFQMYTL